MELRRLPSRMPRSGTTFNDLPFEILACIFEYVEASEGQKKLRLVCSRWKANIESNFNVEVHVTNENYKSVIKTGARYVAGKLSDCLPLELCVLPLFRSFCSRLRKVEFSGVNLPETYFQFLSESHFLKELSMDQVKLIQGSSDQERNLLETPSLVQDWLPTLTVLRFIFHEDDTEEASQLRLFKLLSKVLTVGRLERLYLTVTRRTFELGFVPAEFLDEGPETLEGEGPLKGFNSCLRKIIQSNERTLRILSVECQEPYVQVKSNIELEFTPRVGGKFCLKQYKGLASFTPNPPTVALGPILGVQRDTLQKIDLHFVDRYPATPNFFTQVESTTSEIIINNCNSLVMIKLSITRALQVGFTGRPIFRYAGVFEQCTALKSLTLLHGPLRGCPATLMTPASFPTFTGLEQLPPTLTHFTTTFTFSSPVGRIRELELGNLRNLVFLDWGASPWFILNGSTMEKIGINEYNALRQKLPGLKSLNLRIQTKRIRAENPPVWITTISGTKGLLQKFHKSFDEESSILTISLV